MQGEKAIDAFIFSRVAAEAKAVCLEEWGTKLLVGGLALDRPCISIINHAQPTQSYQMYPSSHPRLPALLTRGAALSDGGLVILESEEGIWAVRQFRRNFFRPPVMQLALSSSHNMLMALDYDGISAYALPNLSLKAQAARTKGAKAFDWDEETMVFAVSLKRRAMIVEYDGLEFCERRDVHLQDVIQSISLVNNDVYAGLSREYVRINSADGVVFNMFAHSATAPWSNRISGNRVALLRDPSTCLIFGPGFSSSVNFSGNIRRLGVSTPYLVAAAENIGLEIRLMDHSSVVQRLATEECTFLKCSGSSLYVISEGQIFQLRQLPAAMQAASYLDLGEYEQALAMCRLLTSETQAKERVVLEDRIRMAYATHLFEERRFEDAFLHLGMSTSAGPMELLRLIPDLVPAELLPSDFVKGSSLEKDELRRAVSACMPYIYSYRSRLSSDITRDATNMQRLVDIALVNALLMLPDTGALLRFIQQPNALELEMGKALLTSNGRYSELVALYKAYGEHEHALELLRDLSQCPQNFPVPPQGTSLEFKGPPGVWAAIKYLGSLEPTNIKLIAANARWMLRTDPEPVLEMLANLLPVPPMDDVLNMLKPFSTRIAAEYLEAALDDGRAESRKYDQELSHLYIQCLKSGGLEDPIQESTKLRDLIRHSKHLDFLLLEKMVPKGTSWLEINVALFERLGRHLEALRLCIHQLESLPMAEEYCQRVHIRAKTSQQAGGYPASGERNDGSIHLLLARVLIEETELSKISDEEEPSTDSRWRNVIAMLSRNLEWIDLGRALQSIPGEVSLLSAISLLEGIMWRVKENRRAAELAKYLQRAEHAGLSAALSDLRMQPMFLTDERACSLCFKRLGTSAFVAFPTGGLAHYSCFKRRIQG